MRTHPLWVVYYFMGLGVLFFLSAYLHQPATNYSGTPLVTVTSDSLPPVPDDTSANLAATAKTVVLSPAPIANPYTYKYINADTPAIASIMNNTVTILRYLVAQQANSQPYTIAGSSNGLVSSEFFAKQIESIMDSEADRNREQRQDFQKDLADLSDEVDDKIAAVSGGIFSSSSLLNVELTNPTIGGLLSVEGSSTFDQSISLLGNSANLVLGSNYLSGDGDDEGVFVSSAGNVGIGTSTPNSRLSIVGDLDLMGVIRANGDAGNAGYILQTNGTGIVWVATSSLGLGGSVGTVTSVAATVPTGFSITGSPITTSGTLAITYAAGYEGLLTASSTNWNSFYNTPSTRITAGTGLSWTGNTLNVGTSTLAIALSDTTGTLAGNRGGTGLSTITQNQLLIGGAGNTWSQIATSSLGLSAAFTNSAQLAALLSDESGTGNVVFSANTTLTGTTTAANGTFSGNVGIGTTSPTGLLTIANNTPIFDIIEKDGTPDFNITRLVTSADVFAFQTISATGTFRSNDYRITRGATGASLHEWRIGNVEKMRIDSLGNIGIGTTTPSSLLTVAGSASFGATTLSTLIANATSTFNSGVISATGYSVGNTTYNAGSMIIGTSSGAQLNINGGTGGAQLYIGLGGSSNGNRSYIVDSGGLSILDYNRSGAGRNLSLNVFGSNMAYFDKTNETVSFTTNATTGIFMDRSQNVSIGTTSTSTKLFVAGTFSASGVSTLSTTTISSSTIGFLNVTAATNLAGAIRFSSFGAGTLQTDASGNVSVSSDERLKDIQGAYAAGLTEVIGLDPIRYKWNHLSGLETETIYAGFSAQNVRDFLPDAVGEDKRGFLTLSDRGILAAVVNAIKELWSRLQTNEATDTAQDEEIRELRARLEALESGQSNPTPPPVETPPSDDVPSPADTTEPETLPDNVPSTPTEPEPEVVTPTAAPPLEVPTEDPVTPPVAP